MNPSLDAAIAKALPFFRLDGDYIIFERSLDKIEVSLVASVNEFDAVFNNYQSKTWWEGEADSRAFIIRINEWRKRKGLSQLELRRCPNGKFEALEISKTKHS